MKMVPLPDTQIDPSLSAPSDVSPMDSAPMPSAAPESNPMEEAIKAALISPSPDTPAFSSPSMRPEESIFTPAATPSVPRPSDVGNILRALAEDVGGDPVLSQLAAQADQQRL